MKALGQLIAGGLWGAALLAGCEAQPTSSEARPAELQPDFRVIVGQDLDALRGYHGSGLFPKPDGVTVYLSLMNLLNEDADFGGLGVGLDGEPVDVETDWGGGPTSAWKAVYEFDANGVAIGLNFADYAGDGLIDRLVTGGLDAEIDHLAAFFVRIDRPVYLRIGYEFDGAWNPGYEDQPRFVEAYRRIVDRVRAAGADKVEFVWQSATSPIDDVIEGCREDLSGWYPGDEYVDWMGMSFFLPPDEVQRSQVADNRIDWTQRDFMDELLTLAREHNKPVLVAEASPQGFDIRERTRGNVSYLWDGPEGPVQQDLSSEQIWSLWYEPFFDYVHANSDVIRGIAYINVRWDDQGLWDAPYEGGYWGDTRLELDPELTRRWLLELDRFEAGTDVSNN